MIPVLAGTGMLPGFSGFAFAAETADTPYPRVYRTFVPEAGPSAFAVELSPTLALSYDPLRGGVNEAWNGKIDLSPTLRAKINEPAEIQGSVFYRESLPQPLRPADPLVAPERRFQGYEYREGAVVFKYTLAGVPVRETLRASEDGDGFERIFHLPDPGGPFFFLGESQDEATVAIEGGSEVDPGQWRFEEGKTFTMRIDPSARAKAGAPVETTADAPAKESGKPSPQE